MRDDNATVNGQITATSADSFSSDNLYKLNSKCEERKPILHSTIVTKIVTPHVKVVLPNRD